MDDKIKSLGNSTAELNINLKKSQLLLYFRGKTRLHIDCEEAQKKTVMA